MELNINGIMDTAYSYGDQRLTNERFTGWTGYYTYDPRGSVSGVTDDEGMIWQSYRYDVSGEMTFGKPQYNNVYSYNAESYNPNMDNQYLRARYYSVGTGNFMTEDSYLGDIADPLTLNRYNYVSSSPLNYVDPSGHKMSAAERNKIDSLASHLIDDTQARVLGDDFVQLWNEAYVRTQNDEQRWELVDAKNALLYGKEDPIMNWIIENPMQALGTVLGAGGYLLLGFYTGGTAFFTSAPLIAAAGTISTGAFTGMMTGTYYNDSQKKELSEYLADKYGIDSSNIYTYDLENLPSEVQNLCSKYMEYENKNRTYEEITQKALGFAAFLMIAQSVYDTGKTMSEYWKANKGGSGATVDNFIKNNVNSNFQKNVKNAFTSDAKVTVLTEDKIVYRYHGGDSSAKSYWYTPNKTANPGADLALPSGNSYTQVDKLVIPKGTEIMEGTVAPNFGQPGGGYQYYVPDPSVVKKY